MINSFPENLGEEETAFTAGMRDLVHDLVKGLPEDKFVLVDGLVEMRVNYDGFVWCFMGQPLSKTAMTGAHPARISWWRQMAGRPVLFVAVQGDVGWMKRITGRTPEPRRIAEDPVRKRRGWKDYEMTKVAFTGEALERKDVKPSVLFNWHLRPEEYEPEGLF